jgi:hypothetical protein
LDNCRQSDQPSQINFENEISIKLLKLLDAGAQSEETPQVFVEDEEQQDWPPQPSKCCLTARTMG